MTAELKAPTTVSFGIPKAGKILAITCAEVTPPQSGTIQYIWERSVSGGIFTQIGITTVNGFNDTVPASGTTYNIRVKAVDSFGNESGYRTGIAQEIDYNIPPVISGADENKGTVSRPFSYAYTVTDPDIGDVITVTETVDGKEIRTYTATSGAQNTADISGVWQALSRGTHRLVITAADQNGESAIRTVTFSREVARIAAARVVPLPVMPKKVFLSLFPIQEPGTASITCQVCNNPFDSSPVWEDISGKQNALVHTFSNTTVATTNGLAYRFTITPAEGQTASFFEAVVRYA